MPLHNHKCAPKEAILECKPGQGASQTWVLVLMRQPSPSYKPSVAIPICDRDVPWHHACLLTCLPFTSLRRAGYQADSNACWRYIKGNWPRAVGCWSDSQLRLPTSCRLRCEIAVLKTELRAAREWPGQGRSQRISPQGLAVKSPTSSRSKLSEIHLAGPKHLSHLYWMREIAFSDRCPSRKLATEWISIKRIPFSPGFHYKIGKFVTLGGTPLRRLKWTLGMKKKLT